MTVKLKKMETNNKFNVSLSTSQHTEMSFSPLESRKIFTSQPLVSQTNQSLVSNNPNLIYSQMNESVKEVFSITSSENACQILNLKISSIK